jgi:hypothetical protein
MAIPVGDRIRVGVVFGGTPPVRPVWFLRGGREVRIRAVTWTWESRDGGVRYRHFAVTDGANVYELRYEAEGMRWTVAEAAGEIPNPNPQIPINTKIQNPNAEEHVHGETGKQRGKTL